MRSKVVKIMLLALIILLPLKINADETQKTYTNANNVTMPYEMYENLVNFYNSVYVDYLTQSEYNDIVSKNIDFSTIHKDIKYFRYEYNKATGEVTNTEVTEDEYNNSGYVSRATTVETAYKMLTLSVAHGNTDASISLTNIWKQMPAVRSYDVIGLRLYNLSVLQGTQTGKQIYTLNGTTDYVSYAYNGTNINNLSNGFGISMNLLDSNITYLQNNITVTAIGNSGTKAIFGSYQHAVNNITLATSKSYTLGSGGLGDVFLFTGSLDANFDGMRGTYYSF